MPDLKHWIIAVIMGWLLMLIPLLAQAAEVTLQWSTVERATGYKVYHGTESRVYEPPEDVGTATTYTLTLDAGTYYFAATAYNQYGESGYSEELSAMIEDDSNPVEPGGFTGTINYRDGRIIEITIGEQ